jgi:hypothetical protein
MHTFWVFGARFEELCSESQCSQDSSNKKIRPQNRPGPSQDISTEKGRFLETDMKQAKGRGSSGQPIVPNAATSPIAALWHERVSRSFFRKNDRYSASNESNQESRSSSGAGGVTAPQSGFSQISASAFGDKEGQIHDAYAGVAQHFTSMQDVSVSVSPAASIAVPDELSPYSRRLSLRQENEPNATAGGESMEGWRHTDFT